MDRRGFIQSVFGTAVMAVAAKAVPDDGVALKSIKHPILLHDAAHHDLTGGFGLAPAKAEGIAMLYDKGYVLSKANAELMRTFGMDPDNDEHVLAWLEQEDADRRIDREIVEVCGYDADLDSDSFEELWIDIEDQD